MPVDFTDGRYPTERLPDDPRRNPVVWVCPGCGAQNLTPLEQGCPACGAGGPGHKATERQPSYEELQARMSLEPIPVPAPRPPRPAPVPHGPPPMPDRGSGLAARFLAGGLTADTVRQIIREELDRPGLEFSAEERNAIAEGLKIVQHLLSTGELSPEERHKYPDQEGMVNLFDRITGVQK